MELNALFQLKRVGKSIVGDVGKLCGVGGMLCQIN